jgi:hypothetical protein
MRVKSVVSRRLGAWVRRRRGVLGGGSEEDRADPHLIYPAHAPPEHVAE